MCLKLEGEVRENYEFKPRNSESAIKKIKVLARIGKGERIIEVTNWSKKEVPKGKCALSVVPYVREQNGRAFLNYNFYGDE